MSMKEFNSGAGIMFCVLLGLWLCVASLWKTAEVVAHGCRKMNVQAYYDTMDRMDAAVERFWRAEK